jgi:signal peptidase
MTALVAESDATVEGEAPREVRGALSWIGQVLSWFVMLGIGVILLVTLLLPRFAGATTYVIETGSMRPDLPPGTMVAVKPADPYVVHVGDVITYQLKSGESTVVTHRVIAVGYDGSGQMRWQTQGDANTAVDQAWVQPAQLKGRLWYRVPYLGYVTSFVTQQQRGVLVVLAGIGLGGYALLQFRGAWLERRRRELRRHRGMS